MTRNLSELGPHLQKIISRLMANDNLVKLLYYSDPDPLAHDKLTSAELKTEIYEKLIKIVPRVGPKETAQSILVVRVVNGRTDSVNNEFRNFLINIEVFVPLTQWIIKDSNLRPFAIMGEVQKSLKDKIIDGFGKISGGDFIINFLTEEISCYEMSFEVSSYD